MFSKACEYAIRSVVFISVSSLKGERVGFKEIAKEIDAPEAFTAKILQKLSKSGIVESVKGVGGGFEIPITNLDSIKLCEVVNIIDGDSIYKGCGLGLAQCSETHPCPVHFKFKAIREGLRQMLENTTLRELANGTKSGDTFLKV
ncbi:Rrf2 family transcriptional regulator [Myroides albus]|uniref:Rrf2 family transcriptional regulator n=1 Tax=Myroides albus TaxID=2562892 RepID=A0A6I3LNG1_9FLAO|nr:Rrf2 family transcriptional regulator [Myroides albus]MTG98850.1 Rrf2 family transcriptional regulator [Myroides albus]UVD80453.1 Rrf2 family transcriptional regulator [Myroides albus]